MERVYVLMYRIEFHDEGDVEEGLLHRGTRGECERVADLIPAIAYKGERMVRECRMGIFEAVAVRG